MACSREFPSDPACRIKPLTTELPAASAICLIKMNGKLLALKHASSDLWNLPYQKQQHNISAQCTAHQSAWKTAGLNVEVGNLQFVNQQNTHFFNCVISGQFLPSQSNLPVPAWANKNVKNIEMINIFATRENQWENTIDLIQLRTAFTQLTIKEGL